MVARGAARGVLDEPRDPVVHAVERRGALRERVALAGRRRGRTLAAAGAPEALGERLGGRRDVLQDVAELELLHVGGALALLGELELLAAEVDLGVVVQAR